MIDDSPKGHFVRNTGLIRLEARGARALPMGTLIAKESVMKVACHWKDAMAFTATAEGHEVPMDAKRPIGRDTAMTPKELVAVGLCGCTAMDVVAYLRKFKSPVKTLEVAADIETSSGGHPMVFKKVKLVFRVTGEVDPAKLTEAVNLSQSQYCGVSAMLSKAMGISYTVELNGTQIASGEAKFS